MKRNNEGGDDQCHQQATI